MQLVALSADVDEKKQCGLCNVVVGLSFKTSTRGNSTLR